MRDAEKFKVGFLTKLAELGMMPSDVEQLHKQASIGAWLQNIAGSGMLAGKRGLQLAIGFPLVGGVLAGIAAREAANADDEDLDEVKTRELADQYRAMAREVRERAQRDPTAKRYG